MKNKYRVHNSMYLLYFFGLILIIFLGLSVYASKSIFIFSVFFLALVYFTFNFLKVVSFRVEIDGDIVIEKMFFEKRREFKIEDIKRISLSKKILPLISFIWRLSNFFIYPPYGIDAISFDKDEYDFEKENDWDEYVKKTKNIFPSLPVDPKIIFAIK
jgi:hypothetical protein